MKTSLAIVIVLSLITGCKSPTTPPSGGTITDIRPHITGTITDSVRRTPVAGATIALYTIDTVLVTHTLSDSRGSFVFDTITPGTYYLVITQSDYYSWVRIITISAGIDFQENATLQPITHTGQSDDISFHVIDGITKQPLLTATVTMDGDLGGLVDMDGNSGIYGSIPGERIFEFSAPGYTPVSLTVYFPIGYDRHDTIPLFPHFDTLLCKYTFNGSAVDWSGKGHEGTLHGCKFTFDRFGIANSALLLNGSADYISVADAPDLNFGNSKSFSFCFWTKGHAQTPSNQIRYILRKMDSTTGLFVGYNVSNLQSAFNTYCGTTAGGFQGQGSSVGMDNTWHFLAYVYDGNGTLSFYYDGNTTPYYTRSDISYTRSLRGPMTNSSPLNIGSDGSAAHAFKGAIDDLRIYEGALLPDEINVLYHENGW